MGRCSAPWKFSPLQVSSCFSFSAKTVTVDFGITQLEGGGCHGAIEYDPVTYSMDKQKAAPKKLYVMFQKSIFVIMENLIVL